MHGLISRRRRRSSGAATHESHARAMAVMRLRATDGHGAYGIMNYSFTGARLLDLCDDSYPKGVPIPNPVSAEHGLLRTPPRRNAGNIRTESRSPNSKCRLF